MPSATQKVDMILGVTSRIAGKTVEGLIAMREILNADEFSIIYSTDYPFGGTEVVGGYDVNNNESLETVTFDPRNPAHDYVFETRAYSDMTSTNPPAAIMAPWSFDASGGFVAASEHGRPSAGFSPSGAGKNNGMLITDSAASIRPPRAGDPHIAGLRPLLPLNRASVFRERRLRIAPNRGSASRRVLAISPRRRSGPRQRTARSRLERRGRVRLADQAQGSRPGVSGTPGSSVVQ
jgi:hypothetical protein